MLDWVRNGSDTQKYWNKGYIETSEGIEITSITLFCTKFKNNKSTVWKVSKYGVFSGPYFPIFSSNTRKYEPEKTPYLDTFNAVVVIFPSAKSAKFGRRYNIKLCLQGFNHLVNRLRFYVCICKKLNKQQTILCNITWIFWEFLLFVLIQH